MPASVGRVMTFEVGGTAYAAGVRTKSITINDTPIDVTGDDDSGYRTLLETGGEKQIDISLEGIIKDDDLVAQIVEGTLISTVTLTLASGATIAGDFRINTLELGAPYNEAVTFTATIQSTGSFDYTAAV